jgi:hypothetical protein
MSKMSSNNGEYNHAIYVASNGLATSVKDGKTGNTTALFKRLKADLGKTTKNKLDEYLLKIKTTTFEKLLDKIIERDKDKSCALELQELKEMYLKLPTK